MLVVGVLWGGEDWILRLSAPRPCPWARDQKHNRVHHELHPPRQQAFMLGRWSQTDVQAGQSQRDFPVVL
ncbi:hypothetical protein PoB_007582700 [Plakobranchus ocellatus]|uniref:Secreted protein n=1 Tax=Plakobranchus ocellatus TaxID=259542 RepID=A0AAV4DY94_9GAST|nr:hypothetical protein PoB_007582700 [Plakobranchus ocellatus]